MTKEQIMQDEYKKLVMNWEKAYQQSPSIFKAAHAAMQRYADQESAVIAIKFKEWVDKNYTHYESGYGKHSPPMGKGFGDPRRWQLAQLWAMFEKKQARRLHDTVELVFHSHSFQQGYANALACIIQGHGISTLVEEAYKAGLPRLRELKDIIEPYDYEILKKHFK